jgi:hypothetical protein
MVFGSRGLEAKDPANRALAVTGNSLACSLAEKSQRSKQEADLENLLLIKLNKTDQQMSFPFRLPGVL